MPVRRRSQGQPAPLTPRARDRADPMTFTEPHLSRPQALRAWFRAACERLAPGRPPRRHRAGPDAAACRRSAAAAGVRLHTPPGNLRRARLGARMAAAFASGGCLLAGGCSTLLPSSRTEVVSDWGSYDDAVTSLATFAPYTSTRQSVHAQGLEPSRNPAITVLHFADVLQRFAAATLIKPEDVDRGIRDCLQAGKQCNGYAIAVEKLHRQRIGSFWLDSLNFRRETVTTGWRVDALLVFVDDALVYQLVGGRPAINEVDLRRNPLGPLQGWGDQSLQMIR